MTNQSKNTDRATGPAVPENSVADGDEWSVAKSLEELILSERWDLTASGREILAETRRNTTAGQR